MTRKVDLSGKVVAVTGGAQGIGREIARLLASAGAKVAIGDLGGESAKKTANELEGTLHEGTLLHRTLLGFDLDVTDNDSFAAFLAAVEAEWGAIDVLVNNAGVM